MSELKGANGQSNPVRVGREMAHGSRRDVERRSSHSRTREVLVFR